MDNMELLVVKGNTIAFAIMGNKEWAFTIMDRIV